VFASQPQSAGRGEAQAGGDLVRALGLDQLVDETADLARVARGLGEALLAVVQFLDDLHRQVDVVPFELEQRGGVVHQDVGVEHVNPLAFGHHWSLAAAFRVSNTASAWPGTRTLRQAAAMRPSGSTRNVLRSMPIT